MKLQKAIEIIQSHTYPGTHHEDLDLDDALKLGIEALKRRLEYNHKNLIDFSVLLPGETSE